ncbi:DUF1573 domain-containing protein [Putridiphycobacter roseus]|nr:DUF1573 domain-containing protein [Putridiphycobacter roseus]
MKKTILYLFAAGTLVACSDSKDGGKSVIQFSDADKSEISADQKPTKGPLSKITSIEYMEVDHNYGDVFYPSDNKYTFKFKNTGTEPLTIISAKASCGCTVPRKPEAPVLPGEIGEMDVVFQPKEGQIGQEVTKRITVTANTQPSQTYLDIKANVVGGM